MPQLTTDQCLDLLAANQPDYDPKITSIAQSLQSYEVMQNLITGKRFQQTFEGANGANWKIITGIEARARLEGLHPRRTYTDGDVTKGATAHWSYANTYAIHERREFSMNMGKNKIMDLQKIGEYKALLSAAVMMEGWWWGSPADVNDKLTPLGVWYWITYNASNGFFGGNQTNFPAGKGGLSSSLYSNYKNRTANYTAVTSGDAILHIRNSLDDCTWVSPVNKGDFRTGSGKKRKLYAGQPTVREFENQAVAQNDKLGGDVAAMDGITTIRRHPFIVTRQLDAYTTSAPIVGLSWDDIAVAVPNGGATHRHKPRILSDQPNSIVTDYDYQFQFVFLNLRSHFLVAKADPLADM